MKKLQAAIEALCPEDKFETGYASLAGLLAPKYAMYGYGISIARRLDDPVIDMLHNGPTPEYYDLYKNVNDELNSLSAEIARLARGNGIEAVSVGATVPEGEFTKDYLETLRHDFSHKLVATRAGMGWIGKTDLFISRRFGPRLRLASVLTMAPVCEPGTPVTESMCGNCRVCVDACPAGAATGLAWKVGVDRNEFYDPFRCMNYCRQVSARNLGKTISICGICVQACPVGRNSRQAL